MGLVTSRSPSHSRPLVLGGDLLHWESTGFRAEGARWGWGPCGTNKQSQVWNKSMILECSGRRKLSSLALCGPVKRACPDACLLSRQVPEAR